MTVDELANQRHLERHFTYNGYLYQDHCRLGTLDSNLVKSPT
jgi:hypothetical protein